VKPYILIWMQIALVTLSYTRIPPEDGHLFEETYVGVENIFYTYL
jgi:hypothetical protein